MHCSEDKIQRHWPVWTNSLRCRTPGRCHSLCCTGSAPMRANPSGESGSDHCPDLECNIDTHWQQSLKRRKEEYAGLFHFHSWIPVTIALWSSNKNIIVCRIWTEYSIWQHRIEWRYHRRDKMCACTFLLQITTVVLFDLDIYSLGQIKQRETSFNSFLCSLSFPSHFWLTHDPVSRFDVRTAATECIIGVGCARDGQLCLSTDSMIKSKWIFKYVIFALSLKIGIVIIHNWICIFLLRQELKESQFPFFHSVLSLSLHHWTDGAKNASSCCNRHWGSE